MKYILEVQVTRSRRIDARLRGRPLVALFEWKVDNLLIESGEYTVLELERLVAEMPSGDPASQAFTSALRDLKTTAKQ